MRRRHGIPKSLTGQATDARALQHLAQVCRRAFDKDSASHELAPARPEQLLTLARRHRVQALCWKGLGEEQANLPDRIRDALCQDSRAIAEQGLRAVAASRELLACFQEAGLPLLFLKGQALGQLAYGNPFSKMSADIDILVRPEDISAAASLLDQLGYRIAVPRHRDSVERWHESSKESVWLREGFPPVELHSHVSDNRRLLPGLTVCSASQLVDIGHSVSLPTFRREELFAYLSVHGASSAWFRLKWLCDFAALSGRSEEEVGHLYRRSIELGCGRASGWALLLSRMFFGTAIGQDLLAELEGDRALAVLVRIALAQLGSTAEPTERPFGTLGIHGSQLLLKPGLAFPFSEAARQISEIVRR